MKFSRARVPEDLCHAATRDTRRSSLSKFDLLRKVVYYLGVRLKEASLPDYIAMLVQIYELWMLHTHFYAMFLVNY